jgi:hypothetical protein
MPHSHAPFDNNAGFRYGSSPTLDQLNNGLGKTPSHSLIKIFGGFIDDNHSQLGNNGRQANSAMITD